MRCALLLFLSLFVLASAAIAQPRSDYSESVPYTPRANPAKKPKKKEKPASPAVAAALTTAQTGSILIPVSVMSPSGRFIDGLKKDDFQVRFDNVPAAIESVDAAFLPNRILILVDTSPSATVDIKRIRAHVEQIVAQLGPADAVSIVQFSQRMKRLNDFTVDRSVIRKSISKLDFGNGTSLYDAVWMTFDDIVKEKQAVNAVVLLTDGVDTTSQSSGYVASLAAAERAGVPVFPVYLDTFPQFWGNTGRVPNSGDIRNQTSQMILIDALRRSGISRYGSREDMEKAYEVGRLYLIDLVMLSGGAALDLNAVAPLGLGDRLRSRYLLKVLPPARSGLERRSKVVVRVNRPNLAVLARGSYIDGGN